MDITFFAILIGIALLIIIIGARYIPNKGLVIIGGLGLILISMILLTGNVTYKTGENQTTTEIVTDNTTDINTTTLYTTSEVNDTHSDAFALFILLIGFAVMAVTYIQSKF